MAGGRKTGEGGATFWNWHDVFELQVLHWEVDDCGILFSKVSVVDEALDVEDQEGRKLCDCVLPSSQLDVWLDSFPHQISSKAQKLGPADHQRYLPLLSIVDKSLA